MLPTSHAIVGSRGGAICADCRYQCPLSSLWVDSGASNKASLDLWFTCLLDKQAGWDVCE